MERVEEMILKIPLSKLRRRRRRHGELEKRLEIILTAIKNCCLILKLTITSAKMLIKYF